MVCRRQRTYVGGRKHLPNVSRIKATASRCGCVMFRVAGLKVGTARLQQPMKEAVARALTHSPGSFADRRRHKRRDILKHSMLHQTARYHGSEWAKPSIPARTTLFIEHPLRKTIRKVTRIAEHIFVRYQPPRYDNLLLRVLNLISQYHQARISV
jgi:hypothetical protein